MLIGRNGVVPDFVTYSQFCHNTAPENKLMRNIVDAPGYALKIDSIYAVVIDCPGTKHEARFHQHTDIEAIQLLGDNRSELRL